MDLIKIKIAADFSKTPGPRYIKEGKFSGQLFRDTILFPKFEKALANKIKLAIDLDDTKGYGTSFLEESFGGLIREMNQNYDDIMNTIDIISKDEDYLISDIEGYLLDAQAAKTKKR